MNKGEHLLRRISTGIAGLDDILGGGFPVDREELARTVKEASPA